jgi:hypothetical protein
MLNRVLKTISSVGATLKVYLQLIEEPQVSYHNTCRRKCAYNK